MKKLFKIFLVLIIIVISLAATACGKKEEDLLGIDYTTEGHEVTLSKYNTNNPVAAFYIKGYGSVVIELYKTFAPNTVNNFISLIEDGYYDDNTFHRLIPGFVLQGGDPTGTGTGGPGYAIKGEFASNGFTNNLRHIKWIVSMARSNSYDSAGSQFFIVLGNASHLDGEYAAFGKVIDGYSNINSIVKYEKVADSQSGQLQNNLTIVKAVVDLKGNKKVDVEKVE